MYSLIKDGIGSDTHGNRFKYLSFLPVSIPKMETDEIRIETDSDILNIYFSVSFSFPCLVRVAFALSLSPSIVAATMSALTGYPSPPAPPSRHTIMRP
jgi:hypothetical protein